MSIKGIGRLTLLLVTASSVAMAPSASQAAGPGDLQIRDAAPTIAGFASADVLTSDIGFPIAGTRPLDARYVAFGLVNGVVNVTTSADGVTWSTPQAATIRENNQTGDLPFLIGNGGRLTVTYVEDGTIGFGSEVENQFAMFWSPAGGDPRGVEPEDLNGYTHAANLHIASSVNGVDWVNDGTALNDPSEAVADGAGAGSFKEGIVGPSDIILNPDGACLDDAQIDLDWRTGSPFDCPLTLVYTAIDGAGNTSIALAGGTYFTGFGWQFRAAAAPALTRAATTFTSAGIDRAHVTKVGSTLRMGFSGSTTSQLCDTAAARCSVGTARSTSGNTFTADKPSAPSISASQAESLAGAAPRSVTDLQLVPGASEERWMVALNGGTWSAYTPAPSVGTAPRILFLAPLSGYVSATEPNITFVMNDDESIGAGPGIDLAKSVFTLDGNPIPSSYTITETAIGQITTPGVLVSIPRSSLIVPDGSHVLTVKAVDLDGETRTASRTIVFDTLAPSSVITTSRTSGFTYPLNSVYVQGSGVDSGTATGLQRMRAVVTNPLGQQRTYSEGPGETFDPSAGFSFSNLGPRVANGGPVSWDYAWAAPSSDALFWAIPGTYRVEISSIDFAGNAERASGAATLSILLL